MRGRTWRRQYVERLDQNFQRENKNFCKCSEIYSSGPKRFGARIEIFEPVYNTMLHQKSSDTHTQTASANTALSLR